MVTAPLTSAASAASSASLASAASAALDSPDCPECSECQKPSGPLQPPPVLTDKHLLSLLLAPDLEDSLTPGALVGADNVALFHLLPLILSVITRIGDNPSRRQAYVRLVSVFRARIAACRGLKLRFLILVTNPEMSSHWNVRLVHRRDCYYAARVVLDDMKSNLCSQNASNQSLQLARQISELESHDSKLVAGWLNDKSTVVSFAARNLLHPTHGIRKRTLKYHMRPIRHAFYGTELVDGIMERANFTSRPDAVQLAQKLLYYNVIGKYGGHHSHFKDDRRRIYQCRFELQRVDASHCRVVTDEGEELTSWEIVGGQTNAIKQIEIQLPMDMIDLQSFEFWTKSVYVRNVEKGYRYGYRAVAHPLYCGGIDPSKNFDFSHLLQENGSLNSNGDLPNGEYQSNGSEDTSRTIVSADEVNDIHHDGSVIGSIVVTKVFSSIARPMIIQLRVPLEDADLDDDDHHIVLPPGLLVKEGDNLAQDLGVEIMFKCFNHIWHQSSLMREKYPKVPFSLSYEVFPTSPTQGFMEAVVGLESLKGYDWYAWREKYGDDKERVQEMIRSTAGSYIGAYVCGGRDRHFDNVLVKDDRHLLHIDFGFLMGTSPPIDGPRIAIAPQMEAIFREMDVWDRFVEMCVDAFMVLRGMAPAIIRTAVLIFTKAGYDQEQIRSFVHGKFSLNVHEKDKKAAEFVRKQLMVSSGDIKTRFKQFAHEHIDPAWYGLLERGFPPAVAIMKLVDAKEQKAAKKLSQSSGEKPSVSDDQKIQL